MQRAEKIDAGPATRADIAPREGPLRARVTQIGRLLQVDRDTRRAISLGSLRARPVGRRIELVLPLVVVLVVANVCSGTSTHGHGAGGALQDLRWLVEAGSSSRHGRHSS
jgi:hypothetical protein